jgi:hypothetical protein
MKVRGYGFVDAVKLLADDSGIISVDTTRTVAPPLMNTKLKATFVLPHRYIDDNRVISYLKGRGIAGDVIRQAIKDRVLYESYDWHNCVFVGHDRKGKARYAFMRGTNTKGDFKCDVEGSNKKYGFTLPPADKETDTVAVFESPIDAMAFKTIHPGYSGWCLSLGCTSLIALSYFLEHNSHVKKCLICTDNDKAGNRAAERVSEIEGLSSTRLFPPAGKDWSDSLNVTSGNERSMRDVMEAAKIKAAEYNAKSSHDNIRQPPERSNHARAG